MIDQNALKEMERIKPGSVIISEDEKTITLIGWELNQHHDSSCDHEKPQNIQNSAEDTCFSRSSSHFPHNSTKVIKVKNGLKWMIYPFTNPPDSTTQRDNHSCLSGEGCKKSCACKDKHKETTDNQNFIPSIKRKFRKWVSWFHKAK